jgi:hypothetical protein
VHSNNWLFQLLLTRKCIDWANADHEGAAKAIIEGIAQHNSSKPAYLIHTSGTGILLFDHMQRGLGFGVLSPKIFNDWDGVGEVTSLPDAAPHRKVDKIVLEAGVKSSVKTAIVGPPAIYGVGRGPVNQRSIQLPDLIKATLEKGHGIQVADGDAHWCGVHVHDLSNVYVRLVEEAVKGGGNATWGQDGYYFAENEDFRWGDIGQYVADESYEKGWIKSKEVKSMKPEDVDALQGNGHGSYLWGVNSRSRAVRARKVLGWEPVAKSIEQEIPEAVVIEAKALGMTT